jgi:hypothetical protein
MAGSSQTSPVPNADNIWDLFSQINTQLPRQAENRRNEELSMPTPVSETAQASPDEASIIDIMGTLLSGTRTVPSAVIGGGTEAVKQLYQHATGSPDAPQTTTEAATRIGERAVEYGVGTKVGKKIGEGIGAATRKIFQKPMTQEATQAQKFAVEGMPLGGEQLAPVNPLPMTPSQMTENTVYGVLENIGKGSVFGGGPLQKFDIANEDLTKRTIEKFTDQLGQTLDKEHLGQMFVMINRGDLRIAQAPAKALYHAIGEAVKQKPVERIRMVPSEFVNAAGQPIMKPEKYMDLDGGAWVDLRGIKAWAKPIANRAEATADMGSDITGGALAKRILAMDDFMPYEAAKDLREVSRALSSQFMIDNKKAPAIGVARHIEGQLTKEIDNGLGRFDPTIRDQWREANKIYAQASSKYDNTFIRHLIKVATEKEGGLPEQVYGMIVKPQGSTLLRRAKVAINAETSDDGKQLWQSFGAKVLHNSLDTARDKTTHRIDFQKLNNLLFSKGESGETAGLGMKSIRELYDNEQIDWLKKAINVGIQQQKGNPTDVGKMLIQMKTGGAIANLANTGLVALGTGAGYYYGGGEGAIAGASTVLLGPEMLAHVMTNPKTAQWFVRGMQVPADSEAGKTIGKTIVKELGMLPGHGSSTILGRMFAQRAGKEAREQLKDQPSKESIYLPPIPTQMQGIQNMVE